MRRIRYCTLWVALNRELSANLMNLNRKLRKQRPRAGHLNFVVVGHNILGWTQDIPTELHSQICLFIYRQGLCYYWIALIRFKLVILLPHSSKMLRSQAYTTILGSKLHSFFSFSAAQVTSQYHLLPIVQCWMSSRSRCEATSWNHLDWKEPCVSPRQLNNPKHRDWR